MAAIEEAFRKPRRLIFLSLSLILPLPFQGVRSMTAPNWIQLRKTGSAACVMRANPATIFPSSAAVGNTSFAMGASIISVSCLQLNLITPVNFDWTKGDNVPNPVFWHLRPSAITWLYP